MAKAPVLREIDDYWFEFFPLSPKEAIKVLVRLLKIVGEPMGLVADQLPKDNTNLIKTFMGHDLGPDAFAKAARALVDRLDENEVEDTIYLLLSKVHGDFDGNKRTRQIRIDVDFAGEVALMFKVVVAALEVNFGDFFGGNLGAVIGRSSQSRAMRQPAEASIG